MRIRASILVRRPIAHVFAYLSTPVGLPDWLAGVAEADGPALAEHEVGATLTIQRLARSGSLTRSTWDVTDSGRLRALIR